MQFGIYEKVLPVETTASRLVPSVIEKPDYVTGKQKVQVPKLPEIKNVNQIYGMKRSCKLAATILQKVEKLIKVRNISMLCSICMVTCVTRQR